MIAGLPRQSPPIAQTLPDRPTMKPQLLSIAILAIAAPATAQTLVVPAAAAAVDGNSSTGYPLDIANGRLIYIYDSSHFTNNGVNFPILISQISYRANSSAAQTWAGGSMAFSMDLSTAPIDYSAVSTTWTANHGLDQTQVFNGTLTIPAGSAAVGSPGPFYATVTFSQPFLYDPALGDLTIDTMTIGNTVANTPTHDCVTTTGTAMARRAYSLTNPPAATATVAAGEVANVLEFTYTPASGLYAGFTADVNSGASPLTVNFTDQSFSSSPGGITSWAWDFNGDSVVDSTLPNPTYVYTTCGTFDVTLTVTDGAFPPSTMTKTAYVMTDEVTAGFTYNLIAPPNVFQFTDTSTPAANAWAWDFDNDGIVDSTAQNPVTVLSLCAAATVKLNATRNCKTDDIVQTLFLAPANLQTLFAANNGLSTGATVFFDVDVTNPQGIVICGMDHNCGTTAVGTPFTASIYVTDGGYAGKDNNIALWRLATTSSGLAAGNDVPASGPLATPLYLPFGSYGIAISYTVGVRYTGTGTSTTRVVYSNADLTLSLGAARSTLFNGGSYFEIRQWNGAIYYDTPSLAGTAGFGYFAPGCAGSLGTTHLRAQNRPQLGQTLTVNLDNLPLSVAVMMTGFSKTLSGFGTLPLDLTVYGAPGCLGRVSPDATLLLIGVGNAASWSFGVPNSPTFVGIVLYNQALVLDPGFNALSAVASDAAGLVLGY